jgi:hypothetical protein
MRRHLLVASGILILAAVLYEMAFRFCTGASGEVDLKAQPPRVYYSDDLLSSFEWRRAVFGFRTHLSFGKVRLAKNTGAYVDGGRFYRRLPDGGWQDMTDTMIEYQKRKMDKNGETVQRTGASRFAQRQIQRHRRLTPVADLYVGRETN